MHELGEDIFGTYPMYLHLVSALSGLSAAPKEPNRSGSGFYYLFQPSIVHVPFARSQPSKLLGKVS